MTPSVIGTVIVTGASRGIGAAIARTLADTGYALCLTHRDSASEADALAADLSARTDVWVQQADIAGEADVLALFERVDVEMPPLHGLVNNAAYLGQVGRRVEDASFEVLRATFDVNVIGLMLCCREAVLRMSTVRGGAGGRIVNISSTAAERGSPDDWVDYAASKAAVNTITKGLALEVADAGIRVNAVAPGLTDTESHARAGQPDRVADMAPRIPLNRAADPAEIAETVRWLLRDAPDYMTGAVLPVAGGF